ncbi:protein SON-like, partial [Saccoglossus kowalevskii]|uniref:Protein SON-like n=1 Tax=Saccoglossus kowalevskii TaxID=10224 RepID=A0ABM0LYA5_SACKO
MKIVMLFRLTFLKIMSGFLLKTDNVTNWFTLQDMFHNTLPVKGGMGMYLLQKMGWKYGEGLGKHKEGSLLPLCLDVKTDRKGLVACGETQKKKAAISMPAPIMKDLSGKHPVSALMEICNKRKWPPPEFNLVHDSGPDHKKNFVFK